MGDIEIKQLSLFYFFKMIAHDVVAERRVPRLFQGTLENRGLMGAETGRIAELRACVSVSVPTRPKAFPLWVTHSLT